MEEVLKINILYKELLSRGHKNFTWLKIKSALDGEANGNLTTQEKTVLKKLLQEVSINLTKTIKSL